MSCVVGTPAPDFELDCTQSGKRKRVRLSDYAGGWLLLFFYPRDFSFVCPTEVRALSARFDEFAERGCEILGVSVDDLDTHDRWTATGTRDGGVEALRYPLASDPGGEIARRFNVFLDTEGVCQRGLFLIDPNGVLQYAVVHNLSVGRSTDDVMRVVTALQTGGLCAVDWAVDDSSIDVQRELSAGRVLSHFRIEDFVGEGASAIVFRATDLKLEREVALKVLRGAVPGVDLISEARLAASVNHPNVCTVHEVSDLQGVPVIAMELVSGGSLEDSLKGGGLGYDLARSRAGAVADGMAAAHAVGVTHGDLKPANVLLTTDGRVKVADFGLASRAVDAEDAGDEPVGAGTPRYLAPERWLGAAPSPAADVFAFGAMFYEMITGRHAFTGNSIMEVLATIRDSDRTPLVGELPVDLRNLLLAALEPDPAQRTVTMKELRNKLSL